MIINCYMSLGCGSEDALRENIARSLALENVEASVNYYRIDDHQAEELGLSGSPSIFINNIELQPQQAAGFS